MLFQSFLANSLSKIKTNVLGILLKQNHIYLDGLKTVASIFVVRFSKTLVGDGCFLEKQLSSYIFTTPLLDLER